jgi:peptidoglycan hydrolase-like protein with peptidoglycan-binding domain
MAHRRRFRPGPGLATILLTLSWWASPVGPAAAGGAAPVVEFYYGEPVTYPLTFPVGGSDIYFADDDVLGFGACRDGCRRTHEGVDILAPKMTPVYAAADATVWWLGSNCCSVFLQHDDGWQTWYIHLNNDTPGTDDGLGWGIAEGIVPGARVTAGQVIGWVGDSGNAENTAPHLHFELHAPGGIKVDPYPSLALAYSGETCTRQRPAPLEALLAGTAVLRLGSTGEAVTQLQSFLKIRGLAVGKVDGRFGPATQAAVRAFQAGQGLVADGLVGPATRGAIRKVAESAAFAELLSPAGPILKLGVSSPTVVELKRWLWAAGYDPGPRPYRRAFDAPTDAAVRSLQRAHGLVIDGQVGPMTRAALLEALSLVGAEVCR